MTWQKCPVCEGRGSLPTGFYSGGPYSTITTSGNTAREECRSCRGKGVLLDPLGSGPYHYEITWDDRRWLTHQYATAPRYGFDPDAPIRGEATR